MTAIIETESTVQEVRTADTIAVEINTIKRQTQKVMLSASIEIGKRLSEARQMVEHGHWGTWLQDNVSYSERTAQNLIKVYEQFGDAFGANEMDSLFASNQPNVFQELSYTQAVALLAIPTMEERKEFVQKNDMESMSTRELQEAIKARKDAENRVTESEKQRQELERKLREQEQKTQDEQQKIRQEAQKRETITQQLEAAKQEIQQLQQNLDEATMAPPDPEKEQRIRELEKTIQSLQQRQSDDEDRKKFEMHLMVIQTDFNTMLKDITAITDDEKRDAYKKAARKLLKRLEELV